MTSDADVFAGSVPENYRLHLEPIVFAPWARRLIEFVGVEPGDRVLDVASGTGVVARLAAVEAGPGGAVTASDISAPMLAHVLTGADPGGAPIETLECSATALALEDGTVDVVLCQQGFPFIPDRAAAAAEMRRVLRSGGRAGAAVWLTGSRLEPFDTHAQILEAHGIEEPFPDAYDFTGFQMSEDELAAALTAGGFDDVVVEVHTLEPAWPSAVSAAAAIAGTPYGPAVAALTDDARAELMGDLTTALAADPTAADPGRGPAKPQTMTAVLGRGTA